MARTSKAFGFGSGLALAAATVLAGSSPVLAATTAKPLLPVEFSFEGPFSGYDQASLQRGFKVYREVCSSCHSLRMIAFRNLGDKGGPFWNPKYPNPNENPVVKSIAKDYQIADIDPDTGDAMKRPGTSADYFPGPYANDIAAKGSNGGAIPPDMSLLARAREGGPHYIYSIVMGDTDVAPPGVTLPPGKHYDPYLPGDMGAVYNGKGPVPVGGLIAMSPPLTDNKVTFDDKTSGKMSQEAKDVASFLEWAADPKMEERKQLGLQVMLFLVVFSGLIYASYRRIWRGVGH